MEETIFVNAQASVCGEGSINAPCQNLMQVKSKLLQIISQSEKKINVIIVLREGIYYQDIGFVLSNAELKDKIQSLTIRNYPGEKAIISGGIRIPWEMFRLVDSPKTLRKLNPKAEGKVYIADLKGTKAAKALTTSMNLIPQDTNPAGIPNVTDLANITVSANYNLLISNGYCLARAGYPKKGYCHVENVLSCGKTTRFRKPGEELPEFSMEHPIGGQVTLRESVNLKQWKEELERTGDISVEGHFNNDWYEDENYVARIEENGIITLLKPTRYGIAIKKPEEVPVRMRFLNLLCELSEEGEWYYDRQEECLYVIPIDLPDGTKPEYVVPARILSLMEFKDMDNVTIIGLTIEDTTYANVRIIGGHHNKVAGCIIKNSAEYGIYIDGGTDNGVEACDIFDVNQAVYLNGGDFKTLTHCNNYMRNNHIYRCRIRGYGMCNINGVGLFIQNNLFHDMNGAVSLKTAETIVEKNEFYNIGFELGDFNCIYFGVDFYIQGNIVRYNFIHHMMRYRGIYHLGGMRCDGEGMGINFYGNVFYKAGAYGVATHGALNTVKNNIVIDMPSMWYTQIINPDGVKQRWDTVKASREGKIFPGDTGDLIYRMEKVLGEKGWEKEPWISKYPKLKEVIDTNPWIQLENNISKNYMTDLVHSGFEFHGSGINFLPEQMVIEFPIKIRKDAFQDPEHLNFAFKKDFTPAKGFETIPFEEIGLYQDEFRKNPPEKDNYRKRIYRRFQGIGSNEDMIYDPDTAKEMYWDPLYKNNYM